MIWTLTCIIVLFYCKCFGDNNSWLVIIWFHNSFLFSVCTYKKFEGKRSRDGKERRRREGRGMVTPSIFWMF